MDFTWGNYLNLFPNKEKQNNKKYKPNLTTLFLYPSLLPRLNSTLKFSTFSPSEVLGDWEWRQLFIVCCLGSSSLLGNRTPHTSPAPVWCPSHGRPSPAAGCPCLDTRHPPMTLLSFPSTTGQGRENKMKGSLVEIRAKIDHSQNFITKKQAQPGDIN